MLRELLSQRGKEKDRKAEREQCVHSLCFYSIVLYFGGKLGSYLLDLLWIWGNLQASSEQAGGEIKSNNVKHSNIDKGVKVKNNACNEPNPNEIIYIMNLCTIFTVYIHGSLKA